MDGEWGNASEIPFVKKLQKIDWGPIAFKLMHPDDGQGWSLDQVTVAIDRYRKFLWLSYLYPDAPLMPTREIDQVWHCHILDTQKYREDCQVLFGQFIDHWPYLFRPAG